MSRKLRFVIALWLSCLTLPLPGQGQQGAEHPFRHETGFSGAFLDPLHQRPVWFNASAEDGMLTLRLDLYAQSVTLRSGRGELHISSSNNRAGQFSTLSEEERGILRRLATYLDQELKNQGTFDASAICAIRNLSSWPADMPFFISIDSATKTVGEVSVPMEEIREARRQALDELHIRLPQGELESESKAITSFCSQIGKRRTACYPSSLVPYREKCENVLVGGTTCRGRCGTTCNGLCSQQRYTKDCHNHDRCADVNGIAHRYCNFIFDSAFDDCAVAPDCVDLPGVWTLTFKWDGSRQATVSLDVNPDRKFKTGDGFAGTWRATDTGATLTFSGGCKPVYTGTLSSNRLTASGTMRCTNRSGRGTWSASKTNRVLPGGSSTLIDGSAPVLNGGGVMSGQPD